MWSYIQRKKSFASDCEFKTRLARIAARISFTPSRENLMRRQRTQRVEMNAARFTRKAQRDVPRFYTVQRKLLHYDAAEHP